MIHHLSQELINKIAAGEVVERPNSVVKELVENSIDAASTEIIIEINEALIRVSDNGSGVERDDLENLFVNHSTSKIKTIEDLSSIETMGFRGEAIATIASVSQMEIFSHHINSQVGYSITPNSKPIETAMNKGTLIEVKNLFYNVPARKKFLKSESIENKYIIDTVTRIALSHPQITFKLIIKDKLIFNLISTNIENRIKAIIPSIKLIPIIYDDIISGFISEPKDSFSKATSQYMFVNGRIIHPSPTLTRAVLTGYKNSIMRGQYPPYIIFINVPPQDVDVNVHPRKLEVRFENDGYIFQKIYTAIQHTLFHEDNNIFKESSPATEQKFSSEISNEIKDHSPSSEIKREENNQKELFIGRKDVSNAMNFSLEILKSEVYDPFDKVDIFSAHQYMNSYIVTQSHDSIIVFDQHACSERFLFEKYKNKFENEKILTKKLLIPEIIPSEHVEFLSEKKDILESFGIKIDEKSDPLVITEIPEFSTLRIVDQLYAELKNIFDNDLSSVTDLRDKMITTLACHSAIRFGDKLSEEECRKIITDLQTCKNKLTCPHGRPTFYEMPKERLVQIFKR